MGLIHIDLFTTLDGVAQAPGGPEEDTEGGFAFGRLAERGAEGGKRFLISADRAG